MKGYKALNCDLSSKFGNMTYDLGTSYEFRDKLELGRNGYHFCQQLFDVFRFYEPMHSRIFEIDTMDGYILEDWYNTKCCSNKIKLIRELTTDDIINYVKENTDTLLNNNEAVIRAAVAKYGQCLDKLVNDVDGRVRVYVARQGYGLRKLVNDPYWRVRMEVARHGYGVDKLIDDHSAAVRFIASRYI